MSRRSSLDNLTSNNTTNNNTSERSILIPKNNQHPKRTAAITGFIIFMTLLVVELIIFLVERPFFDKALPPLDKPWNWITGVTALVVSDSAISALGAGLTYCGLRSRRSTGYQRVSAASGSTSTVDNTDPEASSVCSNAEAGQDQDELDTGHAPLTSHGSHTSNRRSSTTKHVVQMIIPPGAHVTLNIGTTPTLESETPTKASTSRERRPSITTTSQDLPPLLTVRTDDPSAAMSPTRSTYAPG